jgi:hypothetical protein
VSLAYDFKDWTQMRKPQRTFVVELKSGRRRSAMRPDSIWGKTDLKSFVLQAETEAPHLLESKMDSEPAGQGDEKQTERGLGIHPDASHETSDQDQVAAPMNEPVQVDTLEIDRDPVSSNSRLKKHPSRRLSRRASASIREPGLENHTDGTSDEHRERSNVAATEAPTDELMALDAENRRLKALLAKQLYQQNQRLRKMLERFGIS